MHYGNIMFTTIGLGFLVGLAFGTTACRGSEPDPNHCARQDGDTTCVEKFGNARPYCVMCGDGSYDNDGCVEDEPTDLECYSPCGEMQSSEENSSCIEVGDGDADAGQGDGDGDGDGGGDGEPMACMEASDCTDPTPHCLDGECVDCGGMPNGDAACVELNIETPVCADTGCVQCDADNDEACQEDKLICDLEMNVCAKCTEHDQCPDSACNLDMGGCIEQPNIMHVDGSAIVNCNMRDGTEAMPYCTLEDALSKISGEALIYLHAKSSGAAYQEVNTVDDTIVLFGEPNDNGDLPSLQGLPDDPVLSVEPSGKLSLRNVKISRSDVEGLRVMGTAWIEKSVVVDNDGDGIVVDGGTLIVENSFVGSEDDLSAVYVKSGSATMTYVTLVAGDGMAAALSCDAGTTTVVRNSLLVAETETPELECVGAQVSDSALEQMVSDNKSLGSMEKDWFENYGKQNFHLTDNSPATIHTAAKWRTGDPVTDIDGEPRPAIDGSDDFAGADVRN
jgi:hypothetical protein